MLKINKQPSFKKLASLSDGHPIAQTQPGSFLPDRLVTDDKKIHFSTDILTQSSEGLDDYFQTFNKASPQAFRLITKRSHHTHNSWTQNIDELTHGPMGQTNYAYLHPDDAKSINVKENDILDIESATGTIRLPVKLLAELKSGVIAVPHGWGHQGAKGLSVASSISGANVNILASDGANELETVSGMAHLTGIEVKLRPTQQAVNHDSWSGV